MKLGKTLLIANPAAQSGNGAAAALYAGDQLREALPSDKFELIMTEAADHAYRLASKAVQYDTVVALGGDGLIHQVANGLMKIPREKRPTLGVLPVGTGNDYARTLHMDFLIEASVKQLLHARSQSFDIGCCNGEYFVETLSFGLDAAIALDTVRRREQLGKTGAILFVQSGVDMLLHHMKTYDFKATIGMEEIQNQMLMFAVQVGVTYGGGFKICPEAKTDDGLLDVCIARPPLGIPKALMIFLLAKNAHHTRFSQLEFKRSDSLILEFPGLKPPTQIDGEAFDADVFNISCIPKALQVLVP